MESFFIVWCESAGRPTFKHTTFDAARLEAERLATENPGRQFHVLQSVGTAQHRKVDWFDHDQIPF